jgi:hypothetical protein
MSDSRKSSLNQNGMTNLPQLSLFAASLESDILTEKDKMKAQELLTYVLQGNHNEVIKMAKSNPSFFFIKATAADYAKGLDANDACRIYEDWSPYQALFATGVAYTFTAIKPDLDKYLATLENGSDLAYQQEQEKFPNGFDFPPSTYDFSALVADITKGAHLHYHGWFPNHATETTLDAFRMHFKPAIVKSGHPFNMNDFRKAHEVYYANWDIWNRGQLDFFAVCVIGYLERMLTAPYLQILCQGLNAVDLSININQFNEQDYRVFRHSSEVMNFRANKIMNLLPLDSYYPWRLGVNFVVDTYCGGWTWAWEVRGWLARPDPYLPLFSLSLLWKDTSSKQCEILKTYAHTESRSFALDGSRACVRGKTA